MRFGGRTERTRTASVAGSSATGETRDNEKGPEDEEEKEEEEIEEEDPAEVSQPEVETWAGGMRREDGELGRDGVRDDVPALPSALAPPPSS